MKLVYFVRHGLTEGNKIKQFQHPDTPLSSEGLRQAEFVAERFSTIPIDIILTSPMKRARQTAEKIAAVTGKEIIRDDLLKEIKRPSSMIGKSRLEPENQAVEDLLVENFGDPDWRYDDEENYFELNDRASRALAYISERPEENIVVVVHGLILKMLCATALMGNELTPAIFKKFDKGLATFNTSITKFKREERGWYLLTWNDHAHFGEVSVSHQSDGRT